MTYTFIDGEQLTAAKINEHLTNRERHMAGVWRLETNQNVTSGAQATVGDFYLVPASSSPGIDDHIQLNTDAGRGVWTVLKDGAFRIVIKVKWTASSTGHRYIYPWIDNAEVDSISAGPGNGAMLTLIYEFPVIGLAAGQDLRFRTMQNSGATRQLVGSTTGYDTSVVIQRIGDKSPTGP